jgi:hypothetical protein
VYLQLDKEIGMNKRYLLFVLVVLLLAMAIAGPVFADRRYFVWTYGYRTMPAGNAEVEYYYDYKMPDRNDRSDSKFTHQLELEFGITDRWDISLYQVFSQVHDSDFRYDGMKIRTRYRFLEAGQFFVDPLLYLEFKRPANHDEPTVVEGKLVLAKTVNKYFTAFNLVAEREMGSGHELEWKYDIGVGYAPSPSFAFGLESKGNFETGADAKQGLGPTITVAKGSLWFTTGILFPLTEKASDVEFRYILGIFL